MAKTKKADPAEVRRAHQMEAARRGIMLAATRVASRSGYQATTMRAIASEAGYTASSLYTYFGSKEEIFSSLRSDLIENFEAVLVEEMPEGLTFDARLALLVHRLSKLTDAFRDAVVLYTLGGIDLPDENKAHRIEKLRRALELFTEWFRRNATNDELRGHSPEVAARLFHGLHRTLLESTLVDSGDAFATDALKANQKRALIFFLAALHAEPCEVALDD